MITRVEIDGFKTFKNFAVDLAPFQIIIGPNGSGKSNLFDALLLLSRLMDHDLLKAFQALRGEASELFTKYPDGSSGNQIRLAVEFFLDHKWRETTVPQLEFPSLEYTRLRYEIGIFLHMQEDAPDDLEVKYEILKVIPSREDYWCDKYRITRENHLLHKNLSNELLFSQRSEENSSNITIYVGDIDKEEDKRKFPTYIEYVTPTYFSNTLLQGASKIFLRNRQNSELTYYHALAVRRDLNNLRFLHLNPHVLRQPSPTTAGRTLAMDGNNLPTALARMQAEDKYVLGDLSRDMARLVPDIRRILVERDRLTDRYSIQAEMADKRTFSAQALSDGTLRLLALATLKNDSKFHGILCIEEPENGIDPLHLKNVISLLSDMASEGSSLSQFDQPLRQVIITTHSPLIIGLPEAINSLLFALKVNHIEPAKEPLQITRMIPVTLAGQQRITENRDLAAEIYTIDQVRKYLDSSNLNEATKQLNEARASVHDTQ